MIGPAEIEDMRFDLVASADQANPYDVAMGPPHRHWGRGSPTSAGSVPGIPAEVLVGMADRPVGSDDGETGGNGTA